MLRATASCQKVKAGYVGGLNTGLTSNFVTEFYTYLNNNASHLPNGAVDSMEPNSVPEPDIAAHQSIKHLKQKHIRGLHFR